MTSNYFSDDTLTNFEYFHEIDKLREISLGEGIKIALIDSGISPDVGIDKSAELDTFKKGRAVEDGSGHGTAVASIIRRIAPKAEIFDFKVLDKDGVGLAGNVTDGINLARAWKVDIATISLGATFQFSSMTFDQTFEKAVKDGIIMLGATGNDGHGEVDYPANKKGVWAIGSIAGIDSRAKFSNYGKEVDFVALGQEIPTLTPTNEQTTRSGTSFSVPIIAGILALTMGCAKSMSIDYKKLNWYDILKDGSYFKHSASDFGNGFPLGGRILEVLNNHK